MALPVTDVLTNGSTVALTTYSASYTQVAGSMEVTTSGMRGASGTDHLAARNNESPNADQYSQGKITITGVGDWVGVAVRAATASFTGYTLQWFDRSGGNVSYSLDRVNTGSFTNLASGTVAWTNTDVGYLEASGTGATVTLIMKKNTVQFGSTISDTDAGRVTAANRVGFAAFDGTNNTAFMTNWEGGNLAGGAATTRGTPFGHRGTAFGGGRTFHGILNRERSWQLQRSLLLLERTQHSGREFARSSCSRAGLYMPNPEQPRIMLPAHYMQARSHRALALLMPLPRRSSSART